MSTWQKEWREWILRQPWRGSGNHRTTFGAGFEIGAAGLRTDLATVTAELEQARLDTQDEIDALNEALATERAAHEETRRALNFYRRELADHWGAEIAQHTATRASLAAVEARVKLAIETLEETRWTPNGTGSVTAWVASREGQNHSRVMRALEALRG